MTASASFVHSHLAAETLAFAPNYHALLIRLLLDTDGLTSSHNLVVAAGSSEQVAARGIAALADKSFATRIDADHLIVAERVTYASADGRGWATAASSVATRLR